MPKYPEGTRISAFARQDWSQRCDVPRFTGTITGYVVDRFGITKYRVTPDPEFLDQPFCRNPYTGEKVSSVLVWCGIEVI